MKERAREEKRWIGERSPLESLAAHAIYSPSVIV
jgi:hypothetical protein